MPQAVSYTRPDNGVSILHPMKGVSIQRVMQDVPANARNARVIDTNDIPTDRTFRNAWRQGGDGSVDVDMPEARKMKMAGIRAARNAKLDQTDKDVQKADDNNDNAEKQRLRALRKTLRDLPQNVDLDSLDTPDKLKNFWPTELN